MHAASIQAKLQRRFCFRIQSWLPPCLWPADPPGIVFAVSLGKTVLPLAEKSQSCNSPWEIPNCFCDKWLIQWNQLSPIWSFCYVIITWVEFFFNLNILNWIKRDKKVLECRMDKKFNEHKCLQTSNRFWDAGITVFSCAPFAESTSISTYNSKPHTGSSG